jgi:phosphate acetyltransferase
LKQNLNKNKNITETSFIREFVDRSKTIERKIAFSDGNDIRLIKALDYFQDFNNSSFYLIGSQAGIAEKIKEAGVKNTSRFYIIDPAASKDRNGYKSIIKSSFEKRNKEITDEKLDENVLNTSYWASVMLKTGAAHCAVGGSISSTADLMRAVINVLGLSGSKKTLSGAAFVEIPDCIFGINGKFLVSDPAIIPQPTEDQLVDMALSGYETAKGVFSREPAVALLSYSTKGSAKSDEFDKIRNAVQRVKKIYPDMVIDGELQFDAAIVPEVAAIKCPQSPVKGNANVLIFPELNSANTGYKIMQRLAKAEVCGTVVQGAAKPFNDLSRGCLVEDIVLLTAMTLMQLKGMEDSGLI